MANHKSAIKRARQNIVRAKRNTFWRSRMKNETKKVLEAAEENNKETTETSLKQAIRTISKTRSKGVVHKRTASRKISNLARAVNRLNASSGA